MVFQDPMTSLNPSLTVGRQVGEVVRLAERLSREAVRDRVTDLFGQVRMPSPERFLGAYPHQLSGGMRQRVMIAMAIARRPALLIADEPTTALDPTIAAQILDLLASLRASMRMSVLLITHNLALVRGMADRVIVMYAGHVLEEAPTARLFEAPAHPYTEGLLASVPRAGASRLTSRLTPIPGQVPLLREAPDSCVFGPRCPHVRDECRVAQPPLEGGAHSAACVLRRLPEARKAGGQA
jgi:peptide/nickel transport system ATP-binding protein